MFSDSLLESDSIDAPCYDLILFEQLTGDLVRWTTLCIHSAADISGMDTYSKWWLCSSFGSASVTLCNSLPGVTQRLCVHDVDSAFVACWLIPLDKELGIHNYPSKWCSSEQKQFFMWLAMIFRCQLGLFKHVLDMMLVLMLLFMLWGPFEGNNTHATLLVDETNDFYLVNHQTTLHNISVLCLSFSTILKSTYGVSIKLFITGKVNLYPLKALLRVIQMPWQCMILLLHHWLTHFITISQMYLRLGLQVMILLRDS